MPLPLSTTRIRSMPPCSTSTSRRVLPASMAFSSNSLTTLAGRSMTSPAAILVTTDGVSCRMRLMFGVYHPRPGSGNVGWLEGPILRYNLNWCIGLPDSERRQAMSTLPVEQMPAKPAESIYQHFRRLAAAWQAETVFVSSSSDLVAHPAFQELVG